MRVLLIDWIDSCGKDGWQAASECTAELSLCQTVGFLVEKTNDAYCVALNRTISDGHRPYGELITIPKKSIKKVRCLT